MTVADFLRAHERKLRYLAAGAWNTAFGYGAFVALYFLGRRLGLHYLVALTVSNVLAIANAYLTYKHFVFRTSEYSIAEFARFSTVYWVGFGVNLFVLPALVRGLGWNPVLAQALITGLAAVAGYLAHGRFSFQA